MGSANTILHNSIDNMSFLDLDTGAMFNKCASNHDGCSVDNGCVGDRKVIEGTNYCRGVSAIEVDISSIFVKMIQLARRDES